MLTRSTVNAARVVASRGLSTTAARAATASKVATSPEEALEGVVASGQTLLVGGFGLCGIPEHLIKAVGKSGAKDLTIVSNNCGTTDKGLGELLWNKQVKAIHASYVGENDEFERQFLHGELEVHLRPQGTLAACLHAGGSGVPAFYTQSGVGTGVELGEIPVLYDANKKVVKASEPRPTAEFDGTKFLLERSITGEVGLVKAQVADKYGNVRFNKTARNFNPLCARAAKIAIVEVEEIVDELPADDIHLPGVFVHKVVKTVASKDIEKVTVMQEGGVKLNARRERIAKRAAKEFKDGFSVNLGIGIPTISASFAPSDISIQLHSENGLMGIGAYPTEDAVDADLINAGKETVTAIPGASYFDSAESFAMVRSNKLDLTLLGAFEVSADGSIASWCVPGKIMKGPGGAMDLCSGTVKRVVVAMEHCDRKGLPKILEACSLPLTGHQCVHRIITERAVIDVEKDGLHLREMAEGETTESIQAATGATLNVDGPIVTMQQ